MRAILEKSNDPINSLGLVGKGMTKKKPSRTKNLYIGGTGRLDHMTKADHFRMCDRNE
ncbi:protein of unknown function [Candidatus Filomicrobium marinum]|uniref:Uncharacterized protein n=1 Tax=Candidatus Filomicrobium marinum TaxID=1608628 RepID=A0A0D6JLJ9_9HYPH|nr:protein of unknown function [Candidatus Filomicrobium marinum]CPR22552.1 protein of unknown function [Candidatus Filomicrobium marinum]